MVSIKDYKTHNGQGWGITYDGQFFIVSDGSHYLMFFEVPSDADSSLRMVRKLRVFDPETDTDVRNLNELEYIEGYVYANVWYQDKILKIDPKSGYVISEVDFSDLYPFSARAKSADCFNGIAYDASSHLFYVTGKKWPKMFTVTIDK